MSSEIREIEPWEAMDDPGQLKAGDIVRFGEDLDTLDLFNVNLGLFVKRRDMRFRPVHYLGETKPPSSFNGKMRYPYLKQGCVPPSVGLRPKRFLGKLIDVTAMMPSDVEQFQEEGRAHYIATGRLKSSGRPASDPFTSVVTIRPIESRRPLSVTYKNHKLGTPPEQVADQLIEESNFVAHHVIVNGLRYVSSGGLPQ